MISILVIGNEILTNKVMDTNLKFALQHLNQAGYRIDEVRIVRDDIDTIVPAIRELSTRSRFLISSGGIGPTHDDVTLTAFAKAFEVPMVSHPELEAYVRKYFGENASPESLIMAKVPQITELVYKGAPKWPILKVANCYVLPGLPEIFERKLMGVMENLPRVKPVYLGFLRTKSNEVAFATPLAELQAEFPMVELGSYPTYDQTVYAAKITLESRDEVAAKQVFVRLNDLFTSMDTLVDASPPRIPGL